MSLNLMLVSDIHSKSRSLCFYRLRIFNLSTVILRQTLHYELLVLMVHRSREHPQYSSQCFTVISIVGNKHQKLTIIFFQIE